MCCRFFSEVREWEPHRLHLMEFYSTALWHQQKEVQLSALAQVCVCVCVLRERERKVRFMYRVEEN